ncbi:hypothetical protein GALMADRAFT_146544 [Galerina marginata CBS 339.88]|uniref:F-box domain-containing protein n=1 Tax=Galerina marginata (strain CBS 339.88) TaxID=685588 RepID=A0A067SKS1_GALM3|nr:hypothetical protein GALMADRAFT_146544 [Galerina marginata CBS 339.88]
MCHIIDHIILPCIQRIIALTCTLATDAMLRAFFHIPPSLFLSLDKVDLVLVNQFAHHGSSIQPSEHTQFSVFRNLPFLHDVTFHLLNWIHPSQLGLPWDQLASIDLGTMPMPPDIFLTIVQMAANSLTNGRFQVKFTNQSIPSLAVSFFVFRPFQPIIAHVLEKLHLIVINPTHDTRMFSAFHAPALTSLRIELEDVTNGWNPEILVPMLRMMPSLQSVAFAPFLCPLRQRSPSTALHPHNIISNNNMGRFFDAIPTVRYLDLELGLQIGSLTWERLAQGEFLPSLESFRCGSIIGLHVLSAVQRRNQLAEGKPSPGSSQTVARAVVSVLKAITSLHLVVPHADVFDVTASANVLREQPSTANMVFVVEGANLRLFYNIECLNYLRSKENR